MTILDSVIKKQMHYFANKGPSSQSYGFSSSHVQMWELAIKKVEHWIINAFELWCWRRLLRVPWSARRSSQSILKEISPEYSLEGLMLKLKLQYFTTWCEEVKNWLIRKDPDAGEKLKAGREGGNRGWDGWMASSTWWTWIWASSKRWWWTGKPGVLQPMGSERVGHDLATSLLFTSLKQSSLCSQILSSL